MIDVLERAARLAGMGGLIATLVGSGVAAARVRSRAPGRGTGLAPRLGGLTAYLLGAIPYFIVWVVLWVELPGTPPVWLRLVLAVVGSTLGWAGLSLYVWGRRTLGDMYNVSSALGVELFHGHRLITGGPYRYVRHPMYAAIALAALGGLMVYRTWAMVFALLWTAAFSLKAHHEETLLAAEFGPEWDDYAERVPAWLPRTHPTTEEVTR